MPVEHLKLAINYSACQGISRCGKCLSDIPQLRTGPISFDSVEDIPDSLVTTINNCPVQAMDFHHD